MSLKGKRGLAVLLALVFTLSVFGVTAFATGETGERTQPSSSQSSDPKPSGSEGGNSSEGKPSSSEPSGSISETPEPPEPSGSSEPEKVLIKSMTFGKDAYTVTAGEVLDLSNIIISPADATDQSLSWQSSKETVAVISGGTVTALAPGKTTITARALDGSKKSAKCTVTVKAKDSGGETSSSSRASSYSGNDSNVASFASQIANGNSDPSELSSQDWNAIFGGASSEGTSSGDASSSSGSSAADATGNNGGGVTWLFILGIALIVLALLGIGLFVYLQVIQPRRQAALAPSPEEEEPAVPGGYEDLSSYSDAQPQPARPEDIPVDRSMYVTADIDIPLGGEPPAAPAQKPQAPEKPESGNGDFDWDAFFRDNDSGKK